MAYSELIKNFERIRGYMRDFYVYGFKHREQYDRKSARSYDNERRRVESWLGDYMAFRQDEKGKTVFLTVDNRSVPHNPLYKAFRTKSFTANDITLHFYLLDLLAGGGTLTVKEIMEHIDTDYLSQFQLKEVREGAFLSMSTLRKKLNEYEQHGLLRRTISGRKIEYGMALTLKDWKTAVGSVSKKDSLREDDITLHIYLFYLLAGGRTFTVKEIMEHINKVYLAQYQSNTGREREIPDESTVLKKLREYEQHGLLRQTSFGRESAYHITVEPMAWKTAVDSVSETDPSMVNEIILHVYLFYLLARGETLTTKEIMEHVDKDYLSLFPLMEDRNSNILDESTLRNKLKEYEQLGLLERTSSGREIAYRMAADRVDLTAWKTAVDFFSETDPLGVVGSYLLDRYGELPARFSYKHHYLLNALDSEVLYQLLEAIREHRTADITSFIARREEERVNTVLPLKIYVSTQTGRQYLLAFHYRLRRPIFLRLDNIRKVRIGAIEEHMDQYVSFPDKLRENLWGTSLGPGHSLEHLEMTVLVGSGEEYILERLEREKRCGRIEPSGNGQYTFIADVYDASELLPWLRTFIGRIAKLTCSNEATIRKFYTDLEAMQEMYGGDGHAV